MPARNETILIVENTLPRERLDTFLRAQFPTISRGAIQRLIEQGDIRVEGDPVKPTHHPRVGERIQIHWPAASPATAQPQELPLDILFEDDDLLVLNKPPGMVVHPSAGHEESTLVDALLHTGRTHQVRVHFKHLGFPLVGDSTYGNRQNKRLSELTGYTAPRQMLHAQRLAFKHPRVGKRMSFDAAWPEDFQAALAALHENP